MEKNLNKRKIKHLSPSKSQTHLSLLIGRAKRLGCGENGCEKDHNYLVIDLIDPVSVQDVCHHNGFRYTVI